MIISADRYSSMNGNYVIAANESYGIEDMGRILMENERNDMAIFNAALKSDMYEIQCRTEGTLLESELQSLSESSAKEFFKSIAEKLKKFWAKLKGWFQKVYSTITAYCVRNGKAFIAANKKALANLNDSTKIKGKVWISKGGTESLEKVAAGVRDFEADYASIPSLGFTNSTDATKHYLGKVTGDEKYDGSDKSVYEYMKDKYFTEVSEPTVGQCYGGKTAMMTNLTSGIKEIKDIKKAEKECEKTIKKMIKSCEDTARNAAKDLKGDEQTSKLRDADSYKYASTGVTNAMSSSMKALFKLVKFRLAQERIILARGIAVEAKVESALMESMILEAAEDLENLDNDSASDLTPEEEEIVQAVVDAVEEKLEEQDDEGSDEE